MMEFGILNSEFGIFPRPAADNRGWVETHNSKLKTQNSNRVPSW